LKRTSDGEKMPTFDTLQAKSAMNTTCQPLPPSVSQGLLQIVARALCDLPDETAAQREGRVRQLVHTTLGFEPRDGLEYMLSTLVFTHFNLILDSARDALRGQMDSIKAKTNSTIVSLDRAMIMLLKEMRLARRRPLGQSAEHREQNAVPTRAAATPAGETATPDWVAEWAGVSSGPLTATPSARPPAPPGPSGMSPLQPAMSPRSPGTPDPSGMSPAPPAASSPRPSVSPGPSHAQSPAPSATVSSGASPAASPAASQGKSPVPSPIAAQSGPSRAAALKIAPAVPVVRPATSGPIAHETPGYSGPPESADPAPVHHTGAPEAAPSAHLTPAYAASAYLSPAPRTNAERPSGAYPAGGPAQSVANGGGASDSGGMADDEGTIEQHMADFQAAFIAMAETLAEARALDEAKGEPRMATGD
jgi:hypothetical protein